LDQVCGDEADDRRANIGDSHTWICSAPVDGEIEVLGVRELVNVVSGEMDIGS